MTDLLERGSLWNDAVLFAAAHRAARLGASERASRRRRACGGARRLARAASGDDGAGPRLPRRGRRGLAVRASSKLSRKTARPTPSPSARVAAAHGIALEAALPAYLNAFVANLVSVGVRLVPLGQSAGLQVLASLHPLIAATARRAENSTLDDLGSATILADIASMRHETQYSRVFRT